MHRTYLFAYGTLRKGFGLKLMEELADSLCFVGCGQIKATLYDLGSYPAAVKSSQMGFVDGDLFEMQDAAKVLPVLDGYEGDEYQREMEEVVMKTGQVRKAWVYWYIGDAGKALLIEERDYLDYLKNKKDRFV